MSACELCGHDPEYDTAFSDAIEAEAEIVAAAEIEAAETYAEVREDDRAADVALAEVHEDAATDRARIAADAAVAIAEADAAADVATAEVLAAALDDDDDDDDEEGPAVSDEGPPAEDVTPVEVPPQPAEDAPNRSTRNSPPRRRRHRWGR